jgi:hypothetical protein
VRALALCLLTVALGGCGHGSRAPAAEEQVAPVAQAPADPRVPEECSATWVGPRAGGDWDDAGNWSGHRVPGGGDQACIARGRGAVVAHGHYEVGSLVAGGRLLIAADGALDLVDPSTTTIVGDLVLRGTLHAASRVIAGDMTLAGTYRSIRGEGESSGPPVVPCGPHRPLGVPDCRGPAALPSAPRVDTALRAVTAQWRHFTDRVVAAVADDAPANRAAVAALYDRPGGVPRLLRLFGAGGFPDRLGLVLVRGKVARSRYVDFARHGGGWHVSRVRPQFARAR